jgi:predicted glycoside hydrolase/deacetylase ChbG (UPF0249 family)
MAKKSFVIINADDYGYNSIVNRAIIESFSLRLCSSATIMANMDGFEEACALYHQNRLYNKVGLHLVLTEGFPVTESIKKCKRICASTGEFLGKQRTHLFNLNSDEKGALHQEISAQVDRCIKRGIQLTHFDSHEHVHAEWGVAEVLLKVAKDRGIRFIRKGRCGDPNSSFIKNLYRYSLNLRLAAARCAPIEHFGTIGDYIDWMKEYGIKGKHASFEVCIHPCFTEDNVLIDIIEKRNLVEYLSPILDRTKMVSYGDLYG